MDRHWTLDDIEWSRFDATRVDPETLKAVKAAAMVEFNASDYVTYLRRVFADDAAMGAAIERWGREEIQHGEALARWAQLADPQFDFEAAFARFQAGYRLPLEADASVRGSKAGEMIARCVVESGTSSYYSAIRDAVEEPVLKQIASHIAADEYRHYRLFYEAFKKYQGVERRTLFERLLVALSRVGETEDDELAYAYYCANYPASEAAGRYDRAHHSREYNRRILHFYRERHIAKGVSMIAKAVGLAPQGGLARSAGRLLWWLMLLRGRQLNRAAQAG